MHAEKTCVFDSEYRQIDSELEERENQETFEGHLRWKRKMTPKETKQGFSGCLPPTYLQ